MADHYDPHLRADGRCQCNCEDCHLPDVARPAPGEDTGGGRILCRAARPHQQDPRE